MKKYFTELYFYKDGLNNSGYSDRPNLDEYINETIMCEISTTDWNSAVMKIITKHPAVAYVHLHKSVDIDI